MELADLLGPDRVIARLKSPNKKQLLENLARLAARDTGCERQVILDALLEREKLGTTGVGHGIAIPHARLDCLARGIGFFAKLDPAVDFDAIDGQPVSLVFMLLMPRDSGVEHLKALAGISRVLRNPGICDRLKGAEGADALYAVLIGSTRSYAA